MRMKRLFAGVLSAALLGMIPVAISAAPAQAATYTTRVTAEMSYTKIVAGRDISITGKTEFSNGSVWGQVPFGTGRVDLQRQFKGSSTWTTIDTDEYGDSFYFYPVKATQNATYRVVYVGGTKDGHTYTEASASKALKVTRDLGDKIANLKLQGKVKPDYKKKKVTIQVKAKKNGKWKKYATVKTNKKGKWARKLPAKSKCTYWRAFTKGDKKFVKSFSNYSYYTVRGYKSC